MRHVEVDLAFLRRDLGRVWAVGRDDVRGGLRLERLLALGGEALRTDALRLRRREIGANLERGLVFRLDRLCVLGVVERKFLVRRKTAVARAGKRLVWTALAVGEHR